MTLTQQTLAKPINDIKGKLFKVISNDTGHGFTIGETVKLQSKDGRYYTLVSDANGRGNCLGSDLELTAPSITELKSMAEEAKRKHEEYADFMAFLEETKADVLDDTAFKVWKILKIVQNPDVEAQKVELYTLIKS